MSIRKPTSLVEFKNFFQINFLAFCSFVVYVSQIASCQIVSLVCRPGKPIFRKLYVLVNAHAVIKDTSQVVLKFVIFNIRIILDHVQDILYAFFGITIVFWPRIALLHQSKILIILWYIEIPILLFCYHVSLFI